MVRMLTYSHPRGVCLCLGVIVAFIRLAMTSIHPFSYFRRSCGTNYKLFTNIHTCVLQPFLAQEEYAITFLSRQSKHSSV